MSSNPKILSEWYLQLARHLEAGLPLTQAWSLPDAPAKDDRLEGTRKLQAGEPFACVVRGSGNWLPATDREQLVFAGQAGRLPEICLRLAERHKRIAETSRRIRRKLLYPLLVFHLAAIVLPLVRSIDFETGLAGFNPAVLLLQVLTLLLPLWMAIALLASWAKSRNPLLPAILRGIPFLRAYAKHQSMADFCDVLGSAFEVGIPPQQAWKQAAKASRSPFLLRTNQRIQPVLEKGQDPSGAIAAIPALSKDFVAYYQTGSTTGKLDSMILELAKEYEARAEEKLATASAFYPGIALLAVGGIVAFTIFEFFSSYLDLLDSFTQ